MQSGGLGTEGRRAGGCAGGEGRRGVNNQERLPGESRGGGGGWSVTWGLDGRGQNAR